MSPRPRLAIGTWPTPVRLMEETSRALGCEVWVKDEESCGAWGGNKVRKLEYILGEARAAGVSRLASYGGGSSNWTTALAHHGDDHGFHVTVAVAGDIPPRFRELYRRSNTRVVALPVGAMEALTPAAARLAGGRRTRVIPAGGSGPGDIGSAGAGFEIADAVGAAEIPRPALVFAPAGTAGTAAGLSMGMGARGMHVPVVAVRVTPVPYGTEARVRRHARRTIEAIGAHGAVPAPIIGESRFLGPGYGKPTRASLEAISIASRDALRLDGTYAAKAFAALIEVARRGGRGPLLFLHTSPGDPPAAR